MTRPVWAPRLNSRLQLFDHCSISRTTLAPLRPAYKSAAGGPEMSNMTNPTTIVADGIPELSTENATSRIQEGPTWNSIPEEMQQRPHWVVWRLEERDGKSTKVPYSAQCGSYARTNDPSTWASYETAKRSYEQGGYTGVGFVFSPADSYSGIDLDHCLNEDGSIQAWAKAIVDRLASYSEISPSGRGIKIIVKGKLPEGSKHKKVGLGPEGHGAIEFYDRLRYFTITRRRWSSSPTTVQDRTSEVCDLLRELFPVAQVTGPSRPLHQPTPILSDDVLLMKLLASDSFRRLWEGKHDGDHSKADFALCARLAGFCGTDVERIDRMFRQSGLFRAKWDQKHSADGQTYGQMTIKQAMAAASSPEAVIGSPEFLTDMGNSARFASQHRERLRFCPGTKTWLVWDGKRWAVDELLHFERMAKETVRAMYSQAEATEDDETRKLLLKFAHASSSRSRISAMCDLARCEVAVATEQLNSDPWLLTVNNGTIDLRTGEIRAHRQEDYITKLAPVDYDVNAQCPRWLEVLNTLFAGKQPLIDYMQKLLGSALTGISRDDMLPIFYGQGANGKTTLINTVMKLMGDYASPAPPQLLVGSRSSRPPFDIADLRGKRLMVASETESTDRLSEGLVKQLTGRDCLKARNLYGAFFQFDPTHKIILMTNHKPDVQGLDEGIWRRLALIPFEVTIPRDQRDPKLEEKLKAEWPGILVWLVQGCLAWQRDGIKMPPEVEAATQSYRHSSNTFLRFVEEMCYRETQTWTPTSRIREAYRSYCSQIGEIRPLSDSAMASALKGMGYVHHPRSYGRGWLGIGIHAAIAPEASQAAPKSAQLSDAPVAPSAQESGKEAGSGQ